MKQAIELQMTPEEIVRSYREAKDKAAQVGILADLNLCPREMICKILVEGGLTIASSLAPVAKSRRRTRRASA